MCKAQRWSCFWILSFLCLFFSGCGEDSETVKITFIGPLTGGVSAGGLGGRNSADLAISLRNQAPDTKYKYELVSLDDECKPNIGVQVATKAAANKDIVAGVTHYCSAVAMGTVDVYHKFIWYYLSTTRAYVAPLERYFPYHCFSPFAFIRNSLL